MSVIYTGLTQVPIRTGEVSLRNAASTESAVIRPVRGLSEGMFSIDRAKRAESLSTSTVWQLWSSEGSAQIGAVGSDASERQRRRRIDVGRKSGRGVPSGSGEDKLGCTQPLHRDAICN